MLLKNEPSIDEWDDLYNAAIRFKNSCCWRWMNEDDIFGIQDPETGEIGYCSIIGSGGEHYALTAYLGDEGLDQIISMLSGKIAPGDWDIAFIQRFLMCSYEDREQLEPQDLKIIKELRLKFRGKNEWPLFRDYTPGLFPWFITANQCLFLTHILNQAIDISMLCAIGENILGGSESILIRVPTPLEDGERIWEDKYVPKESPDIERKFVSISLNNELLVRKLKSFPQKGNIILEADTFFAPSPVRENDRPYFPKICIITDHINGLIISFQLFKDIKTEGSTCIDMLVDYIEKSGTLPSKLMVSKEETYYLFADVCKQLGIKLDMVEKLESIDEVKADLFVQLSKI